MMECRKCGSTCSCEPWMEPTTFCHDCAQQIITRLETMVPEPPLAISYEQAVAILDALQEELYKK